MPKIDYGELIIHYCDNLTIAMDRAMVTPKDLARLADVPTLRIKKYMTGKALPTSGEYDTKKLRKSRQK